MTIPTVQHLDKHGVLSKECTYSIPEDQLVRGLEVMLTAKYIDERMITLQRQGLITFALTQRGEEAAVVASAAALTLDDWLYPQYREGGIMFWRDYPIEDYVHQMFCNGRDITLGRQMPNHFGSRALNVVTVSSPLASKLPHAAGTAYAMKLQGEKAISLAYFGEGAASKGDFHTALNFAAVRKCPVIFFCRNNGWAISTPTSKQYASDGIAGRGESYGIKSVRVDGNDFFAVHEGVAQAREYCLSGAGPVLIEAMTYRLGAHSTSDDPTQYRDDAEVKAWEKKDPILRLRAYLEGRKLWSAKQEEDFMAELKLKVDNAINAAKAEGPPSLESMIDDVCFEVSRPLQQQLDEVKSVEATV